MACLMGELRNLCYAYDDFAVALFIFTQWVINVSKNLAVSVYSRFLRCGSWLWHSSRNFVGAARSKQRIIWFQAMLRGARNDVCDLLFAL